MRALTARCAVCALHAHGMRAVCVWYTLRTRAVACGPYGLCALCGVRVACELYAYSMRAVCVWYACDSFASGHANNYASGNNFKGGDKDIYNTLLSARLGRGEASGGKAGGAEVGPAEMRPAKEHPDRKNH